MQLAKLLPCSLMGVMLVLAIVPSITAQTTTSVRIVAAPSQAPLQSDGTAQFDVTVQVTAVGIPKSTVQQSGSGNYEILVVALAFAKDETAPTLNLTGTVVAASPNFCLPAKITGQKPGDEICYLLPMCQIASCTTETDDVTFHATLNDAQVHQYHFEVMAIFFLQTPQSGNNLGAPVGGPQGSSWNSADFQVSVVNGPSQTQTVTSVSVTPYSWITYTSSTPNLQLPQPPQTVSQSTNNTQQLVLALAVVAAVVIGAAFLYSRRKGQTVKIAEKVETAVAPSSLKTAEGKRFCIECGNELPPNLKFCDSCGTKQP